MQRTFSSGLHGPLGYSRISLSPSTIHYPSDEPVQINHTPICSDQCAMSSFRFTLPPYYPGMIEHEHGKKNTLQNRLRLYRHVGMHHKDFNDQLSVSSTHDQTNVSK